jgi:hypothetical protein
LSQAQAAIAASQGATAPTVPQPASQSGPAQTAAVAAPAPGPKKPGMIRVGIVMPKYDTGSVGTLTAGEPIRTLEEQLLAGPKIEVVKIAALLPVQATAEAKQLECDYVLTSSVTQKTKTGGFGLKNFAAMAPMTAMIPGGNLAAGMARSMVTTAAVETISMTAFSSDHVKARSELTFEYSLNTVGGASVLKDAQKAKAKSDGEDVITPLVQQGATNIVNLLNK